MDNALSKHAIVILMLVPLCAFFAQRAVAEDRLNRIGEPTVQTMLLINLDEGETTNYELTSIWNRAEQRAAMRLHFRIRPGGDEPGFALAMLRIQDLGSDPPRGGEEAEYIRRIGAFLERFKSVDFPVTLTPRGLHVVRPEIFEDEETEFAYSFLDRFVRQAIHPLFTVPVPDDFELGDGARWGDDYQDDPFSHTSFNKRRWMAVEEPQEAGRFRLVSDMTSTTRMPELVDLTDLGEDMVIPRDVGHVTRRLDSRMDIHYDAARRQVVKAVHHDTAERTINDGKSRVVTYEELHTLLRVDTKEP